MPLSSRTSTDQIDLQGTGRSIVRLPRRTRWIWQDGFCGVIGLRWTLTLGGIMIGAALTPRDACGSFGRLTTPWSTGLRSVAASGAPRR